MDIGFNVELVKKNNWCIAGAPEWDFITQRTTPDEAKKNILELIESQFAEIRETGSLENYLKEYRFLCRLSQQY